VERRGEPRPDLHTDKPAAEILEEAFCGAGDDNVFRVGIVEDVLQTREAGEGFHFFGRLLAGGELLGDRRFEALQ
jgi:hypothetical protein